ncbi:MarR family winged helix-turn-helix transcriptional regulator [Subtercola lobariae]|uniref:MarR family transcriptional regulator n=1 Tax=Subtercola lobariae TaxID=1588641 RepID=A0A917BE15_9MICO|nr:MarR family transcriptional regulator [Subtercola lobariae]GGF39498.1 MarR family transcriptional regulator [Subtercola lobariae]
MSNSLGLGREVTGSLGYLLKHAHLELDALMTRALEPLGVDPRSLGVLRVLASREPTSQQEVAQLLSVDRTTMVALIDSLERQGIVSRTPLPGDRRRNVVELTTAGLDVFARAEAASHAVEHEFVAPLAGRDATVLREALHTIVTTDHPDA